MKKIPFIILLLLIIPFTVAEEVTLTLTASNQDNFANHLITISHIDGSQKAILETNQYELQLPPGKRSIEVILNSFLTPTPDFYSNEDINVNGKTTKTILLAPIGYLQGSVVDMEGNLIPNADLKFTCFSLVKTQFPKKADNTGFFTVPNIPIGDCSVIASTNSAAGEFDFTISQGQSTKAEVILGKSLAGGPQFFKIATGTLAIVIIALLALFFFRRKPKRPKIETPKKETSPQEHKEEQKEHTHSKTTKAIINTLSEKEKKVVNFLLEKNNKASQAKIRHATRIPRTSLSRVLHKLEHKNIISIEKDGKMVTISITDFFLGKK